MVPSLATSPCLPRWGPGACTDNNLIEQWLRLRRCSSAEFNWNFYNSTEITNLDWKEFNFNFKSRLLQTVQLFVTYISNAYLLDHTLRGLIDTNDAMTSPGEQANKQISSNMDAKVHFKLRSLALQISDLVSPWGQTQIFRNSSAHSFLGNCSSLDVYLGPEYEGV